MIQQAHCTLDVPVFMCVTYPCCLQASSHWVCTVQQKLWTKRTILEKWGENMWGRCVRGAPSVSHVRGRQKTSASAEATRTQVGEWPCFLAAVQTWISTAAGQQTRWVTLKDASEESQKLGVLDRTRHMSWRMGFLVFTGVFGGTPQRKLAVVGTVWTRDWRPLQ